MLCEQVHCSDKECKHFSTVWPIFLIILQLQQNFLIIMLVNCCASGTYASITHLMQKNIRSMAFNFDLFWCAAFSILGDDDVFQCAVSHLVSGLVWFCHKFVTILVQTFVMLDPCVKIFMTYLWQCSYLSLNNSDIIQTLSHQTFQMIWLISSTFS